MGKVFPVCFTQFAPSPLAEVAAPRAGSPQAPGSSRLRARAVSPE